MTRIRELEEVLQVSGFQGLDRSPKRTPEFEEYLFGCSLEKGPGSVAHGCTHNTLRRSIFSYLPGLKFRLNLW